ncbi:hypothetical protein SS50377_27214 [Spironucleus salmonicida]|uniref:Uncharacterized protein n=1 Tax=Spironucleus salmonicida TaxID=348837 RepID=V6LWJ7_9EUKA|nr:hypothetical protein SS50377_27214 [Spironucleus salmonicida]|eukprot:EST48950.1 Hypothetical protein SS50377_10794 [Spironucleus salmonicida]
MDFDLDDLDNEYEEMYEIYKEEEDCRTDIDLLQESYEISLAAFEEFDNDPISKFAEQYYSDFFLFRIVALRRVPGIIAASDLSIFRNKIYSILIQTATTFTDEFEFSDRIPSFQELISRESAPAQLASDPVDAQFLNAPLHIENQLHIEKCLILELIPQFFHSIFYKSQEFQIQLKNVLEFVFPLLLALVKSTASIKFISRCYDILFDVMVEIRSKTEGNRSRFDKFQQNRSLLPRNVQELLGEFYEISMQYFVLFPFLFSQIVNFRVQGSACAAIISARALVGLHVFGADSYRYLRESTFPHEENADEFLAAEPEISTEKYNIILQIIRKFPLQFNDFYLKIIVKFAKFLPSKTTIPLLTVLVKQLSGRPVYTEFLVQVTRPLYTFQGSFTQHYYTLIQHNNEQSCEFSLQAPHVNYSNQQLNLTALSAILERQNLDCKFRSIQDEIVSVLMKNDGDLKLKIPFFLASLLRNASFSTKMNVGEFYYKKVFSADKKLVQQYIKNLGIFLQVFSNLNTDDIIIDNFQIQLQTVYKLVQLFLDLSGRVFAFSELKIHINDHEKFYDFFIGHNIQNLPKICGIFLQLKALEFRVLGASQLLGAQQLREYQDALGSFLLKRFQPTCPLSLRYALAKELLRSPQNFRDVLGEAKLGTLFVSVLLELVNIDQMPALLAQEQEASLWSAIQPRFREFAQVLLRTQPNLTRREFGSVAISCGQYRSRVLYADAFPQLLFKFAGFGAFPAVFASVEQIVLDLLRDPVRKVRTAVSRQLGVLLGEIVARAFDSACLLQFLDRLLSASRCTIETRCLVVNVLYNAVRVAGCCDFAFPLLQRLCRSHFIVKATVVKSLAYLARNRVFCVFSGEIQGLRGDLVGKNVEDVEGRGDVEVGKNDGKSDGNDGNDLLGKNDGKSDGNDGKNDGVGETDQAILMFDGYYMQELERWLAEGGEQGEEQEQGEQGEGEGDLVVE